MFTLWCKHESVLALTIVGAVELLDTWQPTVIKGNAAEIAALANLNEVRTPATRNSVLTLKKKKPKNAFLLKVKAQGVDSLGGFENAPKVVRSLARTHRSYPSFYMLPLL